MVEILTLVLSTSPYTHENTYTAIRLAEAALDAGHQVNLIASGDGIYCFMRNQKGKGLPSAIEGFSRLIQKGLKVLL